MPDRRQLRNVLSIAAIGAAFSVVVWSCASVGAGGSSAGQARSANGRGDERRIIGSFADVRAVGVSRRYVFAATSGGIAVYDRLFDNWLPPLSRENGLSDAQITFMAGDPVEDAVWLGVPGAVLVYRPQSEQLQRTMLTGVPDIIMFDRSASSDAFVRAAGQWSRVSRLGLATPVAGPPAPDQRFTPRTLSDVYGAFPGLRSASPLLFRNQQPDRPLRPYQVIAGASSPDQLTEVWLGTAGDGLYKVDVTLQRTTPLRFGLIESGVGALALAADGVWSAGLGASRLRSGLTFASNDLQHWRWIDGTISVPMLGLRSTSMSIRAQRAWIGTDRGVVRARIDGSEAMDMWTSMDGLPDDRVFAVTARENGAWVGTARGLVFITDTSDARSPRTRGVGVRLLANTAVHALLPIGDTLWMGTAAGLLAMHSGGTVARPLGDDPALRGPIVALAWSDTILLAATETAVLRLSPTGSAEPARIAALDVSKVGQVTRLAIDNRTIVMAGTDAVVLLQRSGSGRVLRVPYDLPGPALDVAMSRDWLWIATPDGLVRFRRAADGSVP